MAYGFSLNTMPVWTAADFARFDEGERTQTRVCRQDVLVMVYEGAIRFTVNGEPVEVKAGEYYIIQTGIKQEGNLKCDRSAFFYIHFKENFFKSAHTLPTRGRFDAEEMLPLFEKMEKLIYQHASKVEKATVIYGILMALKKRNSDSKGSQLLSKVVLEVSSNFKKAHALEELARLCGYTKNYFVQAFKKQVGKTPHAFINEMRVSRAKQLLLDTSMSLAEVGEECGFDTYTNFYRSFMRSEGCSPKDWRKDNREKA